MGSPGQTPGMFVKGGGFAWTDEDCVKALIKCNIDPKSFGTYDQRLKEQAKARRDYKKAMIQKYGKGKPHPPPCSYPGPPDAGRASPCTCHESLDAYNQCMASGGDGANQWLKMNSQSGHMSRNAFYQGEGQRADPCSNLPPQRGSDKTTPVSSGGYGYTDNDAFCTDHVGLRDGMEHKNICEGEAMQGAALVDANGGKAAPMSQADLQAGVNKTSDIMIGSKASSPGMAPPIPSPQDRGLGDLTAEQRAQMVDQARQKMGSGLKSGDAAAPGQAGAAGQAQAQTPSDVAGAGPSQADKDKAKKCIEDAWKQSLETMKSKAVTERSCVNQKGSAADAAAQPAIKDYNKGPPVPDPKASCYSDLPPEKQEQVKAQVQAAVAQRQKDLETPPPGGAGLSDKDPSATAKPPGRPTEQDCLEYQGNWLFLNPGLPTSGMARPAPGAPAAATTNDTTGDNQPR